MNIILFQSLKKLCWVSRIPLPMVSKAPKYSARLLMFIELLLVTTYRCFYESILSYSFIYCTFMSLLFIWVSSFSFCRDMLRLLSWRLCFFGIFSRVGDGRLPAVLVTRPYW